MVEVEIKKVAATAFIVGLQVWSIWRTVKNVRKMWKGSK